MEVDSKSKNNSTRNLFKKKQRESIFSVIKRIFNGTNEAEAYNYQIKKKTQKYNLQHLSQLKFNKKEDFYKIFI